MRLSDTEALLSRLPEISTLARLSERNDWHDDNVLQQSLRLVEFVAGLPASLRGAIGSPETSLHSMLPRIVGSEHGNYTAQELLIFVALIHDIGKAETYQLKPDGTTCCPDHEAIGARMARNICKRFDFTPVEKELVVRLVGGHGEPYALFKRIAPLSESEREQHLRQFEEKWRDDLLLLLLLAYGDLVTSHLSQRRPEKHAAILAFYQDWLRCLVGQVTEDKPRTDR